MEINQMPLNHLPIGASGRVDSLLSNGILRRRLLDLGLIKGTRVEALQRSPAGDPIAYLIRGTVIALRDEDARQVLLEA